jgi:hypothetical protein
MYFSSLDMMNRLRTCKCAGLDNEQDEVEKEKREDMKKDDKEDTEDNEEEEEITMNEGSREGKEESIKGKGRRRGEIGRREDGISSGGGVDGERQR